MSDRIPVGVAYPWREQDRQALREALPLRRIPLSRSGSILQPCARCKIPVSVGPRLQLSNLTVICAMCAHTIGLEGF